MEKNFCIFRNMQENREERKRGRKEVKTLPGSLSSCKCVVIFSNCMQKEERKIREKKDEEAKSKETRKGARCRKAGGNRGKAKEGKDSWARLEAGSKRDGA